MKNKEIPINDSKPKSKDTILEGYCKAKKDKAMNNMCMVVDSAEACASTIRSEDCRWIPNDD